MADGINTLGFDVDVRHVYPCNVIPFHGVASQDRLNRLKDSLSADGWNGTPIVVYDNLALGGAHRIAAARDLDIDVPVIDIEDLIHAAGEDPTDYDIQTREDAIEALGVVPGISEFA